MSNPEEFARLSAILGSIPDIDQRLAFLDPERKSTEWSVVDKGLEPKFGAHTYEFQSGKAVVDFRRFETVEYLSWFSHMPDFLRFGEDMGKYQEFLDFSLDKLPAMLFGRDQVQEGEYLEKSVALLNFDKLREDARFNLGEEKDRLKLVTQFVVNPHRIKTLTIAGKKSDGGNPYWFILAYPTRFRSAGVNLSIGTSIGDGTGHAWNPEITKWAMEKHQDRDKIEISAQSAINLSEAIKSTKVKQDGN